MSTLSNPALPGFSWLSPAYRPSSREVETYARIITAADGDPPEMMETHLHEAELQLWIWRNETRRRVTSRHTALRAPGG